MIEFLAFLDSDRGQLVGIALWVVAVLWLIVGIVLASRCR